MRSCREVCCGGEVVDRGAVGGGSGSEASPVWVRYQYCGDIPPPELEAAHYRETQPHHSVGSSETKLTDMSG